jgi:uncharacterized membrane protein
MRKPSLLALFLLGLTPAAANAQVTFELIGQPWEFLAGTDISADGAVIVGNIVGPYETFRWTVETGAVALGRATVPVLGVGAGSPDVSYDGSRISATIVSDDGLTAVAGIWENGAWTECAPQPPDGVTIDQSDASAWGLSGDGQTLVGLYWRQGGAMLGGSAYPMSWTAGAGTLRLGPGGAGIESGRANAVNFDGSVIAGWRSHWTGAWQPTVWENGVETLLEATPVGCPLSGINHDGTIVLGQDYNAGFQRREAAFWTKTGGLWIKTQIGAFVGTSLGQAYAVDCSADGSIVIGANQYGSNPGGPRDAFVWTPADGMVKTRDFLASNGIEVDPFFAMIEMTAVTPDGRVMIGIGRWTDTFDLQTFRITLAPPSNCPGNADGNAVVDFDDITAIIANWGALTSPWQDGDTNGDCVVNFDDITETIANWGATCP